MIRHTLRFIAFLLPLLCHSSGFARQIIRGEVRNQDSIPLRQVIVQVINNDVPILFTNTGPDGAYKIASDSIPDNAIIKFSKYGFDNLTIPLSSDSIYNVMLLPKSNELKEVVVRAPHTRVKGDTIVYDVSSLTAKGDRSIGDIIRKIPGVAIEGETIYYDGEPINRFYIEGLSMLGGDYSVATKNINPADVASVSIYERHQPKKLLNNIEKSDRAALNLKLKRNSLLRPIGYITAGGGMSSKGAAIYQGSLYGMMVSPLNQTLISANLNNSGTFLPSINRYNEFCSTAVSTVPDLFPFGRADCAADQYYDNKTQKAEGSTIFKLPSDLTLALRVMYGHEDKAYSNSVTRRYIIEDNQEISTRSGGKSIYHTEQFGAEANIERNSSSQYLNNILRFSFLRSRNAFLLAISPDGKEKINLKEISITNRFNTIFKKRSNLFEISSDLAFGNMPEGDLIYTVSSEQTPVIYQTLSGNALKGNVKGRYGYTFSNSLLGGEIIFEFMDDLFKSDEDSFNKMANNDRGHDYSAILRPYWEWKAHNFTWRAELKGYNRNITYRSIGEEKLFRHNKPYIDGSTGIYWRTSPFLHLNLSVGTDHTFGGIKDFIESPLYSSYRTQVTLGNGNLSIAQSLRTTLGLTFSRPLEGLMGRAAATFSISQKNSLTSSFINETGDLTSTSESLKNHGKSVFWSLDISKRITGSGIVFKLFANGLSHHNNSIRQNRKVAVTTNSVNLNMTGIASLFSNRLSIDLNCGYSYTGQRIKLFDSASEVSNFMEDLRLSWFIFSNFEIYCGINGRQSQKEDRRMHNYIFLNGGCRFKRSRYEIELSGKNLTDTRNYQYSAVLPLETTTYSYALRPLEILLSFKWNF